eukprot:5875258-Pyramimonas_sp.AAC.1
MPAGMHRIRVRRGDSVLLDSLWRHMCCRELGEKPSQEKASECSVDLWASREKEEGEEREEDEEEARRQATASYGLS